MTTPQTDPGPGPAKKPPVILPKPVLGVPADEPVQNGGFHKKLEIFERIAQSNQDEKDAEKEGKQEQYQTRTIRRRTKTKDKENKNYERLNVSPVRRRPSHPAPTISPREGVVAKRRVESDPDQTLIVREPERGGMLVDAEALIKEMQANSQLGIKLRKEKPAPPPKKSHLANPGLSNKAVLSAKSSNDSNVTKDVQSPGQTVRLSGGRDNVNTDSGEHDMARSKADNTHHSKPINHSNSNAPNHRGAEHRDDRNIVKTEKRPKPLKPKPVPRAVSQAVNTNRVSVLDMIGTFEGKNNTRTLGRVPKRKGMGLGVGPGLGIQNNRDALREQSKPPGLSRRLSRSLGNINEIDATNINMQSIISSKLRFDIKEVEISSRSSGAERRGVREEEEAEKGKGHVTFGDVPPRLDSKPLQEFKPPKVKQKPEKPPKACSPAPAEYDSWNSTAPKVEKKPKTALQPPNKVLPSYDTFNSASISNSQEMTAIQLPNKDPSYDCWNSAENSTTAASAQPPKTETPPVSYDVWTNANASSENHAKTVKADGMKNSVAAPPAYDTSKVVLRNKSRQSLPRSQRLNRKASVDKPGYAPPLPPPSGSLGAYKTPSGPLHNRSSVCELPVSTPHRRNTRPKSDTSFIGGTIYALPGTDLASVGTGSSRHKYHVLENHNSLPIDAVFGMRISSQTVEDEGGYTIPGSHMWGVYSAPVIDKPVISLPIEQVQAPQPSQSDSRPRSNNNAVPPGVHGYTEPTLPEGPAIVKERNFKPLNKMRRKIHEAFRSKVKTEEDDRASVTSEESNSLEDEVTEKRLTAVRKTKARTSHYCSLEQARKNFHAAKLYEYVVVVSLKFDEGERRYQPCEIRRFPDEVSDNQNDKLRAIPYFCFPDSFKWAPVESYNSETFSFVLTSFDGSRFYGYNRRLLPPGDEARLPEVFCVMSPVPCYPLYFQLLDEIERRRKHSMEEVDAFLKIAYDRPLPRPGSHVRISASLNMSISCKDPLLLQRPQDSRLEHIDFDYLFKCLSIPHVLHIFGSLLLERRIIMFSSYLSKLSKCSQAIAALLYPFAWQHVYVPVLPQKLLDMCCSPTPYIMGMLSLSIPELEDMPLEEVLIVNLDARDFDVQVGDESSILPKRLSQGLEKALKTCLKASEATDEREVEEEISNDCEMINKSISEAFIHFFVELMGHYLNHFQPSPEGAMVFEREGFIKGTPSKSLKRFLEVFTETQMFSLFIQEKETDSEEGLSQSLFDQRIQTYETEKRNSKLLGVVNVKKIGQKLAGTAKGTKVKVK